MATRCMKALLKSKNNNENKALCTQQELLSSLDPTPPPHVIFSYCALSFLTLTLSLRAMKDCTKTFNRVLLEFTGTCPK